MSNMSVIRFLQTFWGLALILGLGGHTLYRTLQDSDTNPPAARSSNAVAASVAIPQLTAPPGGFPTPIGGYPTPAPLTVFLACNGQDGDAARFYVPAAGGFVVLRIDTDIAVVRALLTGEPTRFGPGVNLVQTPCMRSAIREGRVP